MSIFGRGILESSRHPEVMDLAYQIEQKAMNSALLSGVARGFDMIPTMWQPFADMPKAESFQPAIDGMAAVLGKISSGHVETDSTNPGTVTAYPANPALAGMRAVSDCVTSWTGDAADAFAREFVNPFPEIVSNQFIVAYALHEALKGTQQMWVSALSDAVQIGNKTLAALDGMGGSCDKNAWSIAFSVVGAVASIATIEVGGVGAVMTIVGAASGVAGSAASESQYSGNSPDAVVSAMQGALGELAGHIYDSETTIAKALSGASQIVQTNPKLFTPPRPAIAGATAGTIKTDMGEPR